MSRIGKVPVSVPDKGAKGVKILLFFNPHAQSADIQLELAHEVLEGCKKYSMPFFLEIVTYPLPDASNENLVVKSVDAFLQRDVKPDVFKLEYPGSAEACQKITKDLGEIPWILLTQGQGYTTFKENLMIAAKNGASGFLAGRSIWQEIKDHKDTDLDEFLKTTVVDRFKEICEIMLAS
jgi:tagatose-1,6-bisphosphate aldolase